MWNVIAWMWNTSHRLLSWMLLALFWEVLKNCGSAKSLGMSFGAISYPHFLSAPCLPQYKQLFSVTSFLPQQADTFETRSQNKPWLSVSIWMQNVLQRLNYLSICFPDGAAILETYGHRVQLTIMGWQKQGLKAMHQTSLHPSTVPWSPPCNEELGNSFVMLVPNVMPPSLWWSIPFKLRTQITLFLPNISPIFITVRRDITSTFSFKYSISGILVTATQSN